MTAHFVMRHGESAPAAAGRYAAAAAGDAGYVKQGSTTHFNVFYDPSISTGAQLAAGVLQAAERDYQPIWAIFGIGDPAAYLPFNIYLIPGSDGAGHSLPNLGDISVDVFGADDIEFVRMLVVAEVVEVFAYVQGAGWDPGASNGEALSRVLATELYPTKLGQFATAPSWLDDGGRPDWVSRSEGTDSDYVSIGCGTLFLYFLRYQMRFSWGQIVRFGAPTLAQTYQTLTSGGTDAFAAFTAAIGHCFAKGAATGLSTDNPFPMGGCAAISSESTRLDVFTRDYGEVVHLRYPGQEGWFSLTGTHGTAWEDYPAAVSWAPQRADVFARNRDGHLAHWWSGDDMMTFADPEVLGHWTLTSAPAVVSTGQARLDVFAQGAGQALLHWRYPAAADGGPFSAGEDISGGWQICSPPAAVAGISRADVFAVGPNGVLLHWYSEDDGITFTREVMPGEPRLGLAQPAVVAGAHTLDVFAADYSGLIWRWSYHPEPVGSGPYVSQVEGGTIEGRPAVAFWPVADPSANGALHLFGMGTDGNLWHWWTGNASGPFNPPENLGGPLLSPPAVTTWAPGRLDAFAEAPDHYVLHWWYGPGSDGWNGPENVPA